MKSFMKFVKETKWALDDSPGEVFIAFCFCLFILGMLLSVIILTKGALLVVFFGVWLLWRLFRFVVEVVSAVPEKIEDQNNQNKKRDS